MTVRTLEINCMTLYLTLESVSWPKPRWYVAGAKPTVWLLLASWSLLMLRHPGSSFFLPGESEAQRRTACEEAVF